MKRLLVTMSLAVSATIGECAIPDPDAWVNVPKGICITNIVCRSDGLEVDFVTDVPPPYRVGVHLPPEIGFAKSRARPIAYVDTALTHAFVPCSLYDVAVFVQVYKTDDTKIIPDFWRPLSKYEWANWVNRVKRNPMRTVLKPNEYDLALDRDIGGIVPYHLQVIADKTWSAFVFTNGTSFAGSVTMDIPGKWTHDLEFSVTGRDPKVGTGFRLMVFEETVQSAIPCVQVSAAYSAITNMSQEVLVKRGWKSLSSNGAWKIATDWEGAPVMVPCSNAVPYRIYGEGL